MTFLNLYLRSTLSFFLTSLPGNSSTLTSSLDHLLLMDFYSFLFSSSFISALYLTFPPWLLEAEVAELFLSSFLTGI